MGDKPRVGDALLSLVPSLLPPDGPDGQFHKHLCKPALRGFVFRLVPVTAGPGGRSANAAMSPSLAIRGRRPAQINWGW